MKRYSYINKVREWAKGVLPFGILCLIPLCCSCSHIADDEQLIYVKPEAAKRTVLLEDFTGQKCVNCPKGTEVIEQLQEAYGDRVIAVGIHGGPLGVLGKGGLAITIGNEYYDHWKLEYQPVGLVNRHGAVNYPDWITKVKEELARESAVKMDLSATLSPTGEIQIYVEAEAINATYQGHLQVWVLEDGIVATQYMPSDWTGDWTGNINKNYVHNHVFRAAVNGTWGEDITLTTGEKHTLNLTQTVSADWNAQHLSIVAFVYNDNGVEQAIKANITQ